MPRRKPRITKTTAALPAIIETNEAEIEEAVRGWRAHRREMAQLRGQLRIFLHHVSGGFGGRRPDLRCRRGQGGNDWTPRSRPRDTPFLPACRRDPSGRTALIGARIHGR